MEESARCAVTQWLRLTTQGLQSLHTEFTKFTVSVCFCSVSIVFCSKLTLQTGPELLWHVFQLFIRQIKRVWLHLGCGFTYKPPYCRYRSICLPSYPIWKIKQNVWFKMVQGKFDDFSAGAASACTTTQHIHRSLLTWEGSLAALAGLRKWLERLKKQFYSQRNCNGRSRAKPNKEMEKKQLKKKKHSFNAVETGATVQWGPQSKHCQNQNMPKFRWRTLQEAKYSPTGKTISADAGERQIIRH